MSKDITADQLIGDPFAARLWDILQDARDLSAQASTVAGQAERALRLHLASRGTKAGV